MKKILILVPAFLLFLAITACDERNSVENADGYTEIKTNEFTIQPRDWVKDPNFTNKWYIKRTIEDITANIEENGFVLIYMKAANAQTWTILPYTFLDRDSKGNFYSTEYSAWWGVNTIEVQFTDTHPSSPLAPENPTYFKVVSARDVPPAMMPDKVDYSNYENTKLLLNMPN